MDKYGYPESWEEAITNHKGCLIAIGFIVGITLAPWLYLGINWLKIIF